MVSEEVGTMLVRFMYFVGAGVICTTGINMWRDLERKAALQKAAAAAGGEAIEKPTGASGEPAAAVET